MPRSWAKPDFSPGLVGLAASADHPSALFSDLPIAGTLVGHRSSVGRSQPEISPHERLERFRPPDPTFRNHGQPDVAVLVLADGLADAGAAIVAWAKALARANSGSPRWGPGAMLTLLLQLIGPRVPTVVISRTAPARPS